MASARSVTRYDGRPGARSPGRARRHPSAGEWSRIETALNEEITDITWLMEQFSRRAPDPVNPAEEHNVRARLVAIALQGLHARATETLPGRPLSRTSYKNRWSGASGGQEGGSEHTTALKRAQAGCHRPPGPSL